MRWVERVTAALTGAVARPCLRRAVPIVFLVCFPAMAAPARSESLTTLPLWVTWGHRSANAHSVVVKLSGQDITISGLSLLQGEAGDELRNGLVRSIAGGGDVDGLSCILHFKARSVEPLQRVHPIWEYLLTNSETEASRRLRADGSFRPDPRKLCITVDDECAKGFSLTVDQLLTQRGFWLPELDLFVSAGVSVSLDSHERMLKAGYGQRVLDRVRGEPEATYATFTSRWDDMGRPEYRNSMSVPPGHIVCLTWDTHSINSVWISSLGFATTTANWTRSFSVSIARMPPRDGGDRSYRTACRSSRRRLKRQASASKSSNLRFRCSASPWREEATSPWS